MSGSLPRLPQSDTALLLGTQGHVRLLVDLGEGRVERLRETVVESARLAVVLPVDHDQRLHVAVSQVAGALVNSVVHADSWDVPD